MIRLTRHAQEMIGVRQIALAWVEAAIAFPDKVMVDPVQAGVTRSYKVIAAAGGRILRVAHRPSRADVLVITAHFDRGRDRMLTTSYDPEADAMFIRLGEDIASARTEEVAPGVLLDFDAAGRVVGIEVLDVRSRMTAPSEAA